MKRHFLLLLPAFFSITVVNAQITINQQDIPFGVIQYFGVDTTVSISLGNGGADQAWDFSSLQVEAKDTAEYTNPEWSAHASSYPGTNLLIKQGKKLSMFANNSSSKMELLGYVIGFQGQPFDIVFNDPQTFLQYPLSYQTSFNDVSSLDQKEAVAFGPGIDSIRLKNNTSFINEVDAYGTVTLPAGSYNVIRLKTTEISTDSLWGYMTLSSSWQLFEGGTDTTYSYEFFDKSLGSVSTVYADSTGNAYLATFYRYQALDVEEIDNAKVNIYPNPAKDELYINVDLNGALNLNVFDIQGKLVTSHNLSIGINRVAVKNLSQGSYIYQITDKEGQLIKTGKLQILR